MTPQDILYLKFISPGTLFILKTISIVISSFFLLGIFYFIKNSTWFKFRYSLDLKEFFEFKPSETEKFQKSWEKIKERLNRPLESEYKLAIIESDNLLNEVLGKMKYRGETLGQKLEQVPENILPNIREVSEAHKIRSNIVHDPDYKITFEKTQRIINIYEKAFQNLNAF